MLQVTITSPQNIVFKGQAHRVILPGEAGIFEVGPFHRPIISLLLPGRIVVDDQAFDIQRGAVKVVSDTVTALIESPSSG